jgi:hypothetical protein
VNGHRETATGSHRLLLYVIGKVTNVKGWVGLKEGSISFFERLLPQQIARDIAREKILVARDIEELRFWNRQWRQNREGVLLEIWYALQRRSGCTQVMRKLENQRYVPPHLEQLGKKPARKPPWESKHSRGRGM